MAVEHQPAPLTFVVHGQGQYLRAWVGLQDDWVVAQEHRWHDWLVRLFGSQPAAQYIPVAEATAYFDRSGLRVHHQGRFWFGMPLVDDPYVAQDFVEEVRLRRQRAVLGNALPG